MQELELVRPDVLVCLGATACKALIDPKFKVSVQRGRPVESDLARHVMGTVHPSNLLRSYDAPDRAEQRERFVDDLRVIVALLATS